MAGNGRKIADLSGKVMGMCINRTVNDPTDMKIYSVNIEVKFNVAYVKHLHTTFPV